MADGAAEELVPQYDSQSYGADYLVIVTGYTSRIAEMIPDSLEDLNDLEEQTMIGRLQLIHLRDRLWGERNGLESCWPVMPEDAEPTRSPARDALLSSILDNHKLIPESEIEESEKECITDFLTEAKLDGVMVWRSTREGQLLSQFDANRIVDGLEDVYCAHCNPRSIYRARNFVYREKKFVVVNVDCCSG